MNFVALLSSKYFAPLFWTQFLGAFNDNLYKNALIILMTLNASLYSDISIELLIPLSGGLFILPFFLFSAIAGQLADKFEKSKLIRLVKVAEMLIMLLAALGFYLENVWFLLSVLFFMGCQSSLFGPVKYSILPQHLSEEGLLKGNAIIEMGTFLAILLGTLVGGILIAYDMGRMYVSALVVFVAVLGWFSSLSIPNAPSANESLCLNYNIFSQTLEILVNSAKEQLIFGSILAISWFWFVGATMLSVFPLPSFIHEVLFADERVITLLLALFSIGIGVGSMLAGRSKTLLNSTKWIVIGALGLSLSALDLYWISTQLLAQHLESAPEALRSWVAMFQSPITAHALLDVLLLGISGGLYIVPLYVILQEYSDIKTRSRTIAANNIVNSLLMVVSAIATMILLDKGVMVYELFALLGIINAIVVLLLYWHFSVSIKALLAGCKEVAGCQ